MKTANMEKIKKAALKVMAKTVVAAAPPYSGDWPWCNGIIHQPKHPRLMEAERRAAQKK